MNKDMMAEMLNPVIEGNCVELSPIVRNGTAFPGLYDITSNRWIAIFYSEKDRAIFVQEHNLIDSQK